MESSAPQEIEEITRRLVAESSPETIIPFGSQAWGHPDDNSDLDLLVVVPESDQPPARRAPRGPTAACARWRSRWTSWVKTREEVERSRPVPASLVMGS